MANKEGSFMVDEWSVEPALDRIIGYSKSTYLRPQVMELLVYLAKHQGQVVSLEDLLNDLWRGKVVTVGTVYNCIAELRNALEAGVDQPTQIKTIPKKGYRLVATVRGLTDPLSTIRGNNTTPSIFAIEPPFIRLKLRRLVVAILLLLLLLLIILSMVNRWSTEQSENTKSDNFVRRYTIDLPLSMRADNYEFRPVTISTDGRRVVFHAVMNGQKQIYSRSLDSLNVLPIKGTENASLSLTLSPNGKWIAFVDERDGMLKKISISGGTPITLCDPGAQILALSWGANGTIVYESNSYAGLMQVSSLSGIPEKLTFPANGEFHKHPNVSPDGNSLFFTIGERGVTTRKTDRIAVLSLQSGKKKVLMEGATPQLTINGYLIYYWNNVLWAAEFDDKHLKVNVQSIPIAEGVHYDHAAHYSIAADGTLLYVLATALQPKSLVWVDRYGKVDNLNLDRRAYLQPNISPNGEYVAVIVDSKNGADLWTYSLEHGTSTRLTYDQSREASPVWSPDGKYIYYSSNRVDDLFRVTTDGSGVIEQLTDSSSYQFGYSITPDGQHLLFDERDGNFISGAHLAVLPVFHETKSDVLLKTEFNETEPELSPDGNWLSYTSDRSGETEIYVRPFPNTKDSVWQVSIDGGRNPRWNPNGQEIFYWGPENLMAVDIKTAPNFENGRPKVLFSHQNYLSYDLRNFDIDPTGERFLMIRKPSDDKSPNNRVVIVQDWLNDLVYKDQIE
ncbi:winged helix-turn-helix domain-containing protein [Thalassotalea nanhaiensis]|uniref:Winged helix-turn-helix domain-containing protein n=1 Tax=Thalassotalea nanhaiensis TaxID=3065648 RepID=A0ABY9TJH6_9GAMM|nr:winged helix-turn-helix domain-containing protein [Colwelliaceae bacterium SQ345]